MGLEHQKILIQFRKIMKKFCSCISTISCNEKESVIPRLQEIVLTPHPISLDDELNAAAKDVEEKMSKDGDGLMNPELLKDYEITEDVVDFDNTIQNPGGKLPSSSFTSVKSKRNKLDKRKGRDTGIAPICKKRKSEDQGTMVESL